MNIIVDVVKWFGVDKEAMLNKIAAKNIEIEQRRSAVDNKHEIALEEATLNLQSTYCPLISGNCSQQCSHYKEGYIEAARYIDDWDQFIAYFEPPRCKLWK